MLRPPPGYSHVYNALDLSGASSTGSKVLVACGAIASVHWDGLVAPQIPIVEDWTMAEYGYVDPDTRTLGLNPSHPQIIEATAVHEIAHMIDFYGLGRGVKSVCVRGHAFTDWRQAVRRTDTHKRLKRIERDPRMRIYTGGAWSEDDKVPAFQEHVEYLLEWFELWARSYFQWVALRSGSQGVVLRQQLAYIRTTDDHITFGTQWPDDEFVSVAQAIDRLMVRIGFKV